MTTKEYLNQIGTLNDLINEKLLELSQYKIRHMSISSVENKERVQTSHNFDKYTDIVNEIIEKEKEIDYLTDKYVSLKEKIKMQIRMLDNPSYKKLLFDKYIFFKSVPQIATERNITTSAVKKAQKTAIKEFEKKHGTIYCIYS